ncbi:protein spaetzle 5 isoform X1 [Microplitis demolitor]|uniref:protein spaetzle 5 isoform X1 n=2 Tax=Microplitis demolitor TaxID=69319 RepID=UPI0004CDB418|nr:protein spaetzle 5 isoform X1 [Microplitis demolitor]
MMGFLESVLIFMMLVANVARGNWRQPCGSYGCPYQPRYEPFVPAPPGHTPRCAKPGQTFCETLDHYPQQLIKFLVEKCMYNFATILKDESQYDFNTNKLKPGYGGYEYSKPEIQNFYQPVTLLAPQYPFSTQASNYQMKNSSEGYAYPVPSESQNRFTVDASEKEETDNSRQSNSYEFNQNPWLSSRHVRQSDENPGRSRRENPFLESTKKNYKKRQTDPRTITLCPTDSHYVTPRAGLNNQGNWMYIVNIPQTRDNYSQLVKSEICTSTTCDGICSLPDGYSSKCEQQYVQKRLVALEGSGDRLYTDVFWIPHGCSCQITPNF